MDEYVTMLCPKKILQSFKALKNKRFNTVEIFYCECPPHEKFISYVYTKNGAVRSIVHD